MTTIDWTKQLHDQLDWHWTTQLRPRLEDLSDDEYFWEPVADCWSIRPRGEGRAALSLGAGDLLLDYAYPEPSPPPVTTIAWRLAHIIVGVFAGRVAGHFGGPPVDYDTFEYAGTAVEALEQLDVAYQAWREGVVALGDDGLASACGPSEGRYAEEPMAMLVLHINREAIHHGAELSLLRDLYAHRSG
jgi:hypothetical protein